MIHPQHVVTVIKSLWQQQQQ